jgi:hypothetical protein
VTGLTRVALAGVTLELGSDVFGPDRLFVDAAGAVDPVNGAIDVAVRWTVDDRMAATGAALPAASGGWSRPTARNKKTSPTASTSSTPILIAPCQLHQRPDGRRRRRAPPPASVPSVISAPRIVARTGQVAIGPIDRSFAH